jgi:hypothetical protein
VTALKTRKPTGLPSWPMVLLAGREGAGKSWAAAMASASELVGRTLWIGIGEDDPDEYGVIPGARFEIVEHDGSYQGILAAVRAAAAEPMDDRPTLLVVDSMTRLWNQLTDNAQAVANRRAKGRKNSNGDYTVSADLWNVAAQQWKDVMDAVRLHRGPAILTARLEQVMVMENGQPTNEKVWKVQGHKSLPFDVGVLIEMHERGHFLMTKAKSARIQIEKPTPAPGFTVETLWDRLGISTQAQLGVRTHADVVVDKEAAPDAEAQAAAVPSGRDWLAEAAQASSKDGLNALWGQIPPHERSQKLRDRMGELAIAFEQRAAEPSPEPEKAWASPDAGPASDWPVAPIPQGEEVRPGEEETPPLEGMEPEAPLTGGDDRG